VPDASAGDATATDNCGTPSVTVVQGTPSQNGCVWSRTDVWTATDACGNQETCSRTYTWTVDTEKPVFTVCPPDRDLGCNPTVPDASAGDATATDNCGTPTVTVAQGMVTGGPCYYSRTDTWTATDDCGNSSTCQRTLTWKVDRTPPELSGCPTDGSYQCYDDVPGPADVTAGDACDGVLSVSFSETQTNPGSSCNNTITRTWSATDDCGNTASCSQTITVHDNVPPAVTYCPPDKTIDCDVPWEFDTPTVDDCDDFATPVIVAIDTVLGPSTGDTMFTAKWVATDVCGNASDTCQQTVTQKGCSTGNGCSFTMGGWGSNCPDPQQGDPNSTQPGCIRDHYFAQVFPNGVMIGQPGHSAKWTTALAVENYLPAGGGPRLLCAGDLINPATTCGGTLAGQLLALKLNVGFSCAGIFTSLGIADPGFCYGAALIPVGCGGPFTGIKVNDFLALADAAIAGNLGVLTPYGATLSDVNIAASCMNELFDNCDPLAPTVGIAELEAAGVVLGDCNRDARHSSSDLVIMVNYILRGATAPQPYAEVTDFNYDYRMNTADVVEMVMYIFKGGIPVR
jgi:hypothetical protein